MGFEDEVEQSFGRPCHRTGARSKRTYELTSSIVPRGTSFHHAVELEFPIVCNCYAFMPLRANPDAMHDHGQATCQATIVLLMPRRLSAPYRAGSVDLARLVLSAGQSKHRPDRLGFSEADGHVNRIQQSFRSALLLGRCQLRQLNTCSRSFSYLDGSLRDVHDQLSGESFWHLREVRRNPPRLIARERKQYLRAILGDQALYTGTGLRQIKIGF
jgi:hypothetical protein